MKISNIEDVKWIYSEVMSIFIGVQDNLPSNEFADIVYAKMEPGVTLPLHYHNRPDPSGYESFFFFHGANITILLSDKNETNIERIDPFHLTFDDKEVHGIRNNDSKPLIFEVLCAPKHREGEEVII